MFLKCAYFKVLSFFLVFCCVINLLRCLGAEAGAGSGAGAGAREQEQEQIKTWQVGSLWPVYGVQSETCPQGISEKRKNYFNCTTKQYGPSFSASHSSTKILTKETEAYTRSCALP